ncbi:hypothetical protein YC2023_085882 [Brassica napus]
MILLSLTICILCFWDPSWRKLLRRFQGRIDIPNRSAASLTLLRRFKPKRVGKYLWDVVTEKEGGKGQDSCKSIESKQTALSPPFVSQTSLK